MANKKNLKRKIKDIEVESNINKKKAVEDEESSSNEIEEEEGDDTEEFDLEASSTESDEDETSNADNETDIPTEVLNKPWLEKFLNKYREAHGRKLYIRFPHKLPADDEELNTKVKALSTLITKVNRPRQKYARFCLVEFQTQEDRDSALKSIKKLIENDTNLKKVLVSLPRTENEEFVLELAERKQKSLENKKAKAVLKRQKKVALREKNYTSSVVILNLPKTATASEVRNLFPHAVDIIIKPVKGKAMDTTVATVNLPSTMDARKVIKEKFSLAGTVLTIKFSKDINKKKKKSKKQNRTKKDDKNKTDTKFTKVLK